MDKVDEFKGLFDRDFGARSSAKILVKGSAGNNVLGRIDLACHPKFALNVTPRLEQTSRLYAEQHPNRAEILLKVRDAKMPRRAE